MKIHIRHKTFLILGIAILIVLFAIFISFTYSDTYIRMRYHRERERWNDSQLAEFYRQPTKLAEHFPATIPDSWKLIAVSSKELSWNGFGYFQARFEVPSPEVQKIYNQATSSAKEFYDGGNWSSRNTTKMGDWMQGTDFLTSKNSSITFPDHYRTFILDGYVEWGMSRGFVISLESNEVIYYVFTWDP